MEDVSQSSRFQFLQRVVGAVGGVTLFATYEGGRAESAMGAAPAQTIMIIRHAEKPATKGAPHGIDINGNPSSESLIPLGWQRAGALVELFAPSTGSMRPGVSRPSTIFASSPKHSSSSMRPLQTVTPTAMRLGLTPNSSYTKSHISQLAAAVLSTSGVSLIGWQHEDIPAIARALGFGGLGVPSKWPGDRFDIVWVFTRPSGGAWSFKQIPQLLLAGDKNSVIAG